MRRDDYPRPHRVEIIGKRLTEFNGVPEGAPMVTTAETVVVDGHPLCLPQDAKILVTADAGGVGFTVTLTLMAGSIATGPYEYVPRHMREPVDG